MALQTNKVVQVYPMNTRVSPDPPVTIDNETGRGCILQINVTGITGTATLTVSMNGQISDESTPYNIISSPTISAVGSVILRVYPAITPVSNAAASDIIPRFVNVSCAHGGSGTITYSIYASIAL